MKVKNISFKEYFELKDRSEYDYYLKYGNFEPFDVVGLGSFPEKTFEFVKDMQFYVQDGLQWKDMFESVSKEIGKTIEYMASLSLFDLHRLRLYCIEQIKTINEMESNYLGSSPSAEELQAGIDRFNEYGPFIQFDKLANGDIRLFEEIKKLKYDLCFTKLKLEADRSEFYEEYQKIMSKKK